MRKKLISPLEAAVLAFAALAAGIDPGHASACRPGDPSLAGHYYLHGLMEVGSELLLRADGSFEFMLAYGANDQYAKGCWAREGRKVSVVPAGQRRAGNRHTPDSRGFSGFVLEIDGRSLVWDVAGSGHKGRYEKG